MVLLRYTAKRLLLIPISIFVVVTLSFGITLLVPGDPATLILGDFATPDQVAAIHHQLGTDRPFFARYGHYVWQLAHGDLGRSYFTNETVTGSLARLMPNTLQLAVFSAVVAIVCGLALGSLSAYFHERWPDRVASVAITILQAIPNFVLALVLIYVVFVVLRWAPSPVGALGLTDTVPPSRTHLTVLDAMLAGRWGSAGSALRHSILPSVSLGLVLAAALAKTVRTTMIQQLESAQVEFARACGLSERRVLHYAFLGARTPILTSTALLLGTLIGGTAILETIFAWPGAGQWALVGMGRVDIPVIQGFILVVGLGTLLIYLALDVVVASLDPRISYA
jgi:ABC-type dipeptide/oligopeptide/nickel transport system permease component